MLRLLLIGLVLRFHWPEPLEETDGTKAEQELPERQNNEYG